MRPPHPSPLRLFVPLATTVATIVLVAPRAQAEGPTPLVERLRERLRGRLEANDPARLVAAGERIHATAALSAFYERRAYAPAWVGERGPLERLDALVAALDGAEAEGLRPADYHPAAIAATRALIAAEAGRRETDSRVLADLELLATDAWLLYGSHCLAGRVNPETIDAEWVANRRGVDLAAALEGALAADRVAEGLRDLLPPQAGYARLRDALAHYRAVERSGGWPAVPAGPSLKPGAELGPRVAALRRRLAAEFGGLNISGGPEDESFDADLEGAVRRFQYLHGLTVDGAAGRETLAALNASVGERIRQLLVNLERWRWLPQDLGARHVLVNVAGFHLDVVEGERAVMGMKVIVGRSYRRTPVFSDRIRYLVLNPQWEVPRKLAVQDVLPQVQKDAEYLATKGFRVLEGWGAEERAVDPATVDWASLGPGNWPYRFRQRPGPANSLGVVKFMFPNKFDVYLHDTPAKELFAQPKRSFSSGCIRVERALDLAEYLLKDDPEWTRARIEETIAAGRERTVPLQTPVPVHLLYWTAWADEDGSIQFREDIYRRDARVAGALHIEAPRP